MALANRNCDGVAGLRSPRIAHPPTCPADPHVSVRAGQTRKHRYVDALATAVHRGVRSQVDQQLIGSWLPMDTQDWPARPEEDSIERFARDLKQERLRAGVPSVRKLQLLAHVSKSSLSDAERGKNSAGKPSLPTAEVVRAYVTGTGRSKDEADRWVKRRDALSKYLEGIAPRADPLPTLPPGDTPSTPSTLSSKPFRRVLQRLLVSRPRPPVTINWRTIVTGLLLVAMVAAGGTALVDRGGQRPAPNPSSSPTGEPRSVAPISRPSSPDRRTRPSTCNGGKVLATKVGCPARFLTEDANGDGLADVRNRWKRGVTTSLFRADGSQRSITFPFPSPKYPYLPPSQWTSGDFNADGLADLLHGWPQGADIWISRGDGRYAIMPLERSGSHGYGEGVWKAGDVTNDGLDDVVHVGMGQVTTWITGADGRRIRHPFKAPAPNYPYGEGHWDLQDFNNDGRADLLHQLTSSLHIWTSRGDGTYAIQAVKGPGNYSYGVGDWRVADISGDGRADLIHASTYGLDTWISVGDARFKVVRAPKARYDYSSGTWRSGDITGDGRADILHEYGLHLDAWLSRGDGTYSIVKNQLKIPLRPLNVGSEWRVRDLTGDRKADLVAWWEDKVAAWKSRGDGTFTQVP